MTNNLSKPQIRFKGFTEAWEQRKVSDLMDVGSVKRIHQADWTDNGIRFLRARDIVAFHNGEEINDPLYISNEKYAEYSLISGKVKINDLLVTGVGTIGIPMLISNEKPLYFKDGNVIWLKNNNSINGKFLFYSFDSNQVKSFINNESGIGTVGTYTINSCKNTPLGIPSFVEQTKIGELFSNIDNLITLHQRKLIFLKSHRFLMSVLFCYSWEQRKLGDIGKTFTGLSGKTSDDFGHGDAKFLPYLNIFNNPIADINFLESTEIDKSQNEIKYGDVFFTTSSETPEEVGMSSVWLGNSENIYLNSFCFGFRPLIDFNPYYFGYLLRSDTFRNPVTILAQGISRFNISKNKVMEIEIPLPEKQEQEKIGQLFYKLDSLITLHQRKQL